ncbi:GMC family oxidoreductase [Myxococcota bacterium]|nr:GMC family oxidoreductase [Myxococcota bacterium]
MVLTAQERRIAACLADAALPAGRRLPGGGPETVERLCTFIEKGGALYHRAIQAGLWGLEAAAVGRTGRPFTALTPARRLTLLEGFVQSPRPRVRQLVRAVLLPLKMVHFDDPAMFAHVGCPYGRETPRAEERRPWMRAVVDGAAREAGADLDLTCDVVVVGTGAGGAAAAYELARRGHAVVMLEAGAFHGRAAFTGRAGDAFHRMYLARGATFALGNMGGPVWAGIGVGGSTTINSGTCYRVPDSTLADWHRDDGLTMLTSATLSPYFERVEAMLGVETAAAAHLGGTARVIARGADAMGLSHHPLRRNAPGCDGQGVCCFGCPTGAKRSTDVSYVPAALQRGATLVTGARATCVTRRGGRATGVEGRLAGGAALRVRAAAVVVAGGALSTPALLAASGLCGGSGFLGRNLSIHPATKVMAVFDERVDPHSGIPQSYAIDTFARDGLMFEGASTPLDVTAMAVPWVGPRFIELMESFPHLATFGFMVKDESRGRVRSGPGGVPIIHYDLGAAELARLARGVAILSEVFLRAGARRVLPMLPGFDELRDEADLARLRTRIPAHGDFDVAAFHPLGTCRMGTDPRRSCVGPDGEAHDLAGLYVADGSALPSSLGVNPQMTIMALALRTAEIIDARLRRAGAPPQTVAPLPGAEVDMLPQTFEFRETMSGFWRRRDQAADRPFTFTLHCRAESLAAFARRREVVLDGTLDAEDLATAAPLEGTLGLDVLRTGTLEYAFDFKGDDGEAYRFVGSKTLRPGRPAGLLDDMTRLPGEVRTADGEVVGTVTAYFDLRRDLLAFLRSWRLV